MFWQAARLEQQALYRWRYAGGLVIAKVELVRGSTTNVGSTSYAWSLPVAANDATPCGAGLYRDATGLEYPLIMAGTTSTTVVGLVCSGNARVSNVYPVTPATSDTYDFTVSYEPA